MATKAARTAEERSTQARRAAQARWARERARRPVWWIAFFPQHAVDKMINVVDGAPLRWVPRSAEAYGARIKAGDVIVPLHLHDRRPCAIARMTAIFFGSVGAWNARAPAMRIAQHDETTVIVGERGTPVTFARPLPLEIARALRFVVEGGPPTALPLDEEGRMAPLSWPRGIRALTAESADELAALAWL